MIRTGGSSEIVAVEAIVGRALPGQGDGARSFHQRGGRVGHRQLPAAFSGKGFTGASALRQPIRKIRRGHDAFRLGARRAGKRALPQSRGVHPGLCDGRAPVSSAAARCASGARRSSPSPQGTSRSPMSCTTKQGRPNVRRNRRTSRSSTLTPVARSCQPEELLA